MPTSLIVGALVLAWLVVLVPMIARKRQVVARTADTALAARVVRRESRSVVEEKQVPESEHLAVDDESTAELPLPEERDEAPELEHDQDEYETPREDYEDQAVETESEERFEAELEQDEALDETELDEADYAADYAEAENQDYVTRPYRPGRGGYNAEAAELAAAAKYAMRRRIVFGLLIATVVSIILGIAIAPAIYWATAILGISLAGYLTYLRRQVRIENDIRARRAARMRPAPEQEAEDEVEYEYEAEREGPEPAPRHTPALSVHPGTTVVDHDDEDPAFAELDDPDVLPYRRAAGQ